MKIMRFPLVNAIFVTLLSIGYASIFIITAEHIEFTRLLSHSKTLQSAFWNSWSTFIQAGNMKYIGYLILLMASIIVLLAIAKREKYDEYQTNILFRCFGIIGILTVFMLPLILLLILSDRNYAIESLFFLLSLQWLGFLITDTIFLIKFLK
ncbi:hypothetical protein [Dehalobacter sp. DCA]|jgi:hypothetical protein|uniref:hypothetical protein n=1 Tax=Dehalobacter sp. DCA TaxID=1147129 RepID=UPI00059BAE4A|nr:hypothetical protein [Dehalobacter sp. DCA]